MYLSAAVVGINCATGLLFVRKSQYFMDNDIFAGMSALMRKNLLDKAKESPVQETIYYPNGLEQQSQKRQISDRK